MDVSLAKLLLETRGKEILSKVKLVNMFTQDGKAELPVKVQTEKFMKQEAAAASKEPVRAPGAPAVERAEAPAVAGAPAAAADDPGKCTVS